MTTARITYEGNLRTRAIHLQSNQELITDAPLDNEGMGMAFSPTDLVATALCSCMATILGIRAQKKQIELKGLEMEIEKKMADNPRRIQTLNIHLTFPSTVSRKQGSIMERIALQCPVHRSLNPDIIVNIDFSYAA